MPNLAPVAVGFLLVFIRCVGLFSVAPILGTQVVQARIRVGIAVPVALAVFLGAGAPAFTGWSHLGHLVGAAATEALVGLAAGAGARFVVEAAYAAGHLASLGMGLGFGSILDPLEGADSTAVAELFAFLALSTLLALGGHRILIAGLARSVVLAPPGTGNNLHSLIAATIQSGLAGIALAVRLAYPVLAAVLVGQVALGVLGRTAPQLNISSVGFSVTILAGGGVLYLTLPTLAELIARATLTHLTGS